jgi:hypothetical protein
MACQHPSRLTSNVVFGVGKLAGSSYHQPWSMCIKQMHVHVHLSRQSSRSAKANGVLGDVLSGPLLVRLALSQTWPSAQRLLYAWPGEMIRQGARRQADPERMQVKPSAGGPQD